MKIGVINAPLSALNLFLYGKVTNEIAKLCIVYIADQLKITYDVRLK